MQKSVSQKMGTKENMRSLFVNAPKEALEAMELPKLDVATERKGQFDYIHMFVKSASEFKEHFSSLKSHLAPTGRMWVSWPKKGQMESDLSLPRVIEMGYTFGLVESTCLRVDDVWSALKFTHPKKGKVYNNKYGKLPSLA